VEKYGTAGQATDDNIIQRMRFACWITKATDTHSEYVILIAFPRQQWLRERASMLRYTYIAPLVGLYLTTLSLFRSYPYRAHDRGMDATWSVYGVVIEWGKPMYLVQDQS
jgi:hypothetical protein